MKIELILLPSADLDRSKDFYVNKVGFHLDHDVQPGNGMRIIQMTPHGSSCSIAIGTGMGTDLSCPAHNTHLVVRDIYSARHDLLKGGVVISDVVDMGGVKYAYFSDPDNNSWALQEIDASAKLAHLTS